MSGIEWSIEDLDETSNIYKDEFEVEEEEDNADLISSMRTFSLLTQSTLSAFHKAGVDIELAETIGELKGILNEKQTRTLVDAVVIEGESKKVERIFKDGYRDVVNVSDIYSPSYFDIGEVSKAELIKLKGMLSDESRGSSNISSIREGDFRESDWVKISRASERVFFYDFDIQDNK
jgi:hypothetical protein